MSPAGQPVDQYSAVADRVLSAAGGDHPAHFVSCAAAGKVRTLHHDTRHAKVRSFQTPGER